jgi:hypothetical protein
VALAGAPGTDPGRARSLDRSAEKDLRRIEREGMGWATPFAPLFRASLAERSGRGGDAASLLERAEEGFRAAGMRAHEAATRRRRGVLRGGGAGGALVGEADAFFRGEGVRRPEKWAVMVSGGIASRDA